MILRNYRVSDYNNCCEDVKLIIRIKTPYKYNSISGGINRRVEHRSSILNAISATMNKEVYVNKQPVREKKTRAYKRVEFINMRESRIWKLACGWVATILNRGKRQSESRYDFDRHSCTSRTKHVFSILLSNIQRGF